MKCKFLCLSKSAVSFSQFSKANQLEFLFLNPNYAEKTSYQCASVIPD